MSTFKQSLIQRGLCVTLIFGLLLALVPVDQVQAAASLSFSPSSGSLSEGGTWKTTVQVSSDGPVNSVDTVVTYPTNILEVTSIDTSGSVFSIVLFQPKAENGTIKFVQTSPSPYSGSGGKVGTINFKVRGQGSGSLGFGSSKVIAQDGKGTNVFSGGASATVTVAAPPPAATKAPSISSSTHPNQNGWYKDKAINYSWSGGASGYNYTVDQSPTTSLSENAIGTVTTASTTVTSDGVWFAHVKAKGTNGWSSTSHYKIQIDSAPPAAFEVTTDPKTEITVLPNLVFSANDSGSGIDHYEVQLDGGAWVRQASPYKVSALTSGPHSAMVRAFDKAGNSIDSQVSFTLKPLEAPVITSPENKKLLMLGEELKVKGLAMPNATVEIYVNDKKVETTVADEHGNFTTQQPLLLFAGAYQIVAKAVNKDGITSPASAPVTLTIDARAVKLFGSVWPGWVVLIGAIALFCALMAVIVFLLLRMWRLSKRWAAKLRGVDASVDKDLGSLLQQVDASIDANIGATTPAGTAVKAALAAEVQRVEADIDTMVAIDAPPPGPPLADQIKDKLEPITPHVIVTFGKVIDPTPETLAAVANQDSGASDQELAETPGDLNQAPNTSETQAQESNSTSATTDVTPAPGESSVEPTVSGSTEPFPAPLPPLAPATDSTLPPPLPVPGLPVTPTQPGLTQPAKQMTIQPSQPISISPTAQGPSNGETALTPPAPAFGNSEPAPVSPSPLPVSPANQVVLPTSLPTAGPQDQAPGDQNPPAATSPTVETPAAAAVENPAAVPTADSTTAAVPVDASTSAPEQNALDAVQQAEKTI